MLILPLRHPGLEPGSREASAFSSSVTTSRGPGSEAGVTDVGRLILVYDFAQTFVFNSLEERQGEGFTVMKPVIYWPCFYVGRDRRAFVDRFQHGRCEL